MTRDPIGYRGGVNLYGYTGNNPVNRRDPKGLSFLGGVVAGGTTIAIIGTVLLVTGGAVISAPVLIGIIVVGAVAGTIYGMYHDGESFGPASADALAGATIAGAGCRLFMPPSRGVSSPTGETPKYPPIVNEGPLRGPLPPDDEGDFGPGGPIQIGPNPDGPTAGQSGGSRFPF